MQVERVEYAKASEQVVAGTSKQTLAKTENVESQEVTTTAKTQIPKRFQDVAPEEKPLASIQAMFALATTWEKIIFFIGNVGAFGNGVIQPGMFLLFGDMIDAITEDKEDIMESLEKACLLMTITGVVDFVFATVQMFGFKYFAEKQAFRFRALYVESVLHQDIAWFDARSVAALPAQMSLDAEKIGEAFGDKLGITFMSLWSIVGGIVCAIIAGWHIGLVCLVVCPFLAFGALHMAKAGQEIQSDTQLWYKKAAVVVEECLYALRTVIAFGSEKRELAHFEYAIEKARKGGVRGGLKIGVSFGFTLMCMYLIYAASLWYGGVLIYNGVDHPTRGGDYSPGAVLGSLFGVLVAAFCVGSFPPGVSAFQAGRGAMARFHDAQKSPTTIERLGKDERLACPAAIESFELSNVHFSYPSRPDVPVLRGLSLKIEKGQKVAVVGESGSGKSTLMALLERFYDPDTGVVMLNGADMKTLAVKTLRRSIGYVGQEPVLFATTVKANILQGSQFLLREEDMDVELERVIGEAELSFIKEMPEGLDTYVGTGGCQFSGGQKQRIVIARALIKNTSVLFFDEATSALDTKSEKMIQHTIDRIGAQTAGKNRVMTMVSIAHRLSTIRHCDLIHVMSRGETVENGTHAELLEMRGSYYALVAAQQVAEAKQAEEEEVEEEKADMQELRKEEPDAAVSANDGSMPEEQQVQESAEAVTLASQPAAANSTDVVDHKENEKKKNEKEKKEKDADNKKAKAKVPMRRVMAFCKPEWPLMVPAVLGAIVDGSAMPVSSVLLATGLDALGDKDKGEIRETMTFIASLLVGLALADFLACVTQHSCMALVGEGMVKRLRLALLQHLFRQEVGFHDDPAHSPAVLGEALELWTYRMSNLVKVWGGKSGAFTSIFLGMTIGFIYSWEMALGLILAVPLMIGANMLQFLLLFGTTSADGAGQQAQQVLSDAVQNARVCHACVSEDAIVSLYVSLLGKTTQGLVKRCMVIAFGFGLSFALIIWILAAGFYYAGKLATEGDKEFIDVTAAFLGVFFSAMGAGQCAATLGDADKANTAAQEMFKILHRKSEIDSLDPQGEIPAFANPMDAGAISFEAVRFRYPFRADVEVLKGMSFSVMPGQAAGLVGPSGGGKSTVMALIQRFYDPESGSVQIGPLGEQVQLSNLNIRWWRRQLGFVGQEPILFDTIVKANLLYGFSEEEDEMPSNDWIEQCAQMANLSFLDQEPRRLETEVGPRGSRLSGGQKQRVAICRALIRNPPVLLFDEATSALDSQSEQVVQRALEAVREGRTSFSIAHRLSTIAGCDVILVVSSGVIVEQGSHQDLIDAGGVYSKLAKASGGTARQS